MRADMTDADMGVLDHSSSAIGLALMAPIALRRLPTRWVSCTAIPYKIHEGSQS